MSSASKRETRNPEGLIGVFKLVAEMNPDVLSISSGGSFEWSSGGKQDILH